MSQITSFGNGGGGGGITQINGNTGFASGPVIDLITSLEATLLFSGDNATTMTLKTTDATGNLSLGQGAFVNGVAPAATNVVIGFIAAGNLITGSDNVIIGAGAAIAYTGAESNNIVIGSLNSSPTYTGDSGAIRLGDPARQTSCFIAGIDGVNVGSVATVVTQNVNQLGTAVITAGAGITVTPGANTITIASSGAGDGIVYTGTQLQLATTTSTVFTSFGSGSSNPTEVNVQSVCPSSGTFKNLYINVRFNGSTTNANITLRVNGVSTALVATVTAATTGVFSDTTHSVPVSQGDLISWLGDQTTTDDIFGQITMTFNS